MTLVQAIARRIVGYSKDVLNILIAMFSRVTDKGVDFSIPVNSLRRFLEGSGL